MPEATEESTLNSAVIPAPVDSAADSATIEIKESNGEQVTVKKQKEKVPARVPRSLTDAEYDAIFTAAIERVMNAPVEEETPKEEKQDDFEAVLQEKSDESKSQKVPPPASKVSKKVAPDFKAKTPKSAPKAPKQTDVSNPKEKKVKERGSLGSGHKRKLTKEVTSDKDQLATDAKLKKTVENKTEVTKTSSKLLMVDRQVEEIGIWVQCSLKSCSKWRSLADIHDPTKLPEDWTCVMNTDPEQNSCDAKEAEYDPETEQEDFIYTKYAEGSLVWARLPGYPWWPGLVEIDPDYQLFFECREKPNIASHFHVTFLDTRVSRAWFGMKALRPFTGEETKMGPTKAKGKEYRKDINEAKNRASDALTLLLPDRIAAYGFASRFKGKWGKHIVEGVKKAKVQKKEEPGEVDDGDGDFAGLSGEEVDEILDNAESSIEEAYEALNELLSQQSQDLDEYLPDEPPKKKAKKEKPVKVKLGEKDAGESGNKTGATKKKSLGIKKSASKDAAAVKPKLAKIPKVTKPAKSAAGTPNPVKIPKVDKPVKGPAGETPKPAKIPQTAKPAKPFAPVMKPQGTDTNKLKEDSKTEPEKPKDDPSLTNETPKPTEQTKTEDKTASSEPRKSEDSKEDAVTKKSDKVKKVKAKFAAPKTFAAPKVLKKTPTTETPKIDETKEKEATPATKAEVQKTDQECKPSKPEREQKETLAVDDAELDFDLDIDMDTASADNDIAIGGNLDVPSTSEVLPDALPETKLATETVESDAESLDFEE